MKVWVKVGRTNATFVLISEDSSIDDLRIFLKEELLHLFEDVKASKIIVRNASNEILPLENPIKLYAGSNTPESERIGASEDRPFIVDEPEWLTAPWPILTMEELSAEFMPFIKSMKFGENCRIETTLLFSPIDAAHWYSRIADSTDYSLLRRLKRFTQSAKLAALYGAKQKLALCGLPLTKLPLVRDEILWMEYLRAPYTLTIVELEALRDYMMPALPPHLTPATALNGGTSANHGTHVENGVINNLRSDICAIRAEMEARVKVPKADQQARGGADKGGKEAAGRGATR